jgi:hypothetical protein
MRAFAAAGLAKRFWRLAHVEDQVIPGEGDA